MAVIRKLKAHFARHGIPEQLINDNGPQFVSRDFLQFARDWEFVHLTTSPHHSQANGKAESAVKQAKKILLKRKKYGSDAFLALLHHRNTPPAGIEISPARRLLNRRTRTLLPMTASLLEARATGNEVIRTKLQMRKQQQPRYYNRGARDREVLCNKELQCESTLCRGEENNGRKGSYTSGWTTGLMKCKHHKVLFEGTEST